MENIRSFFKLSNLTLSLFCVLFSISSVHSAHSAASAIHIPPSFIHGEGRIVFADFIRADYVLNFDLKRKVAWGESRIKMRTFEKGHVAFDLVPSPKVAMLSNKETTALEVSDPHRSTTFRMIGLETEPGEHELYIENELQVGVEFPAEGGVRSGFFMSDLTDRNFLEHYLPSNFEYDQVPMTLTIRILEGGRKHQQDFFTNGELERTGESEWKVTFPAHFTSSSLYFHTVPENSFAIKRFSFLSVTGKEVPVTIYGQEQEIKDFPQETLKVLKELEEDYGPWPHPAVLIYGAGRGGMEYCGATRTSLKSLGHELTHSYFARGVMPAHGNAGWIDEAIASWRGLKYYTTREPEFSHSRMGAHSVYRRTTDREAYTKGASFMAYLHHRFSAKGGLKQALASFFETKLFEPMVTSEFKEHLEGHFGETLDEEFNKYIFGHQVGQEEAVAPVGENPHHPVLTAEELHSLL